MKFVRNIYGDEANYGYRSVWEDENGKTVLRKEYYDKDKVKTVDDIKSELKDKTPVDVAFPPTENISDGYHTFEELYHQRAVLFATICNAYLDKSWKSYRHENGELCFGGGWFIVGIDTPMGSYTYHYKNEYWDMFNVKVLNRGKHWDGHTEKDVIRLLTLNKMR